MDGHSTGVPGVTRTRAEPVPEGIDGEVLRSVTDGAGGTQVVPNERNDSSKDWRTDAS